ncbi:MAG: type II toxin-antitoxin system RelE/ParE family toxin [Methylacidiphilales bacterium]|nr:type II toxin-antitoxin system RelE/ParE family toxin [Candidatus Methylacidiphilales bacterium]
MPRSAGCVKLAGREELYRVRVGDYRTIYQIRDHELVVLIIDIGHRREIYR